MLVLKYALRFLLFWALFCVLWMVAERSRAKAQSPSPQTAAAPPPPFSTPPTPEAAPKPARDELPPLPPEPRKPTGRAKVTTEVEGAAIVNNGGVVIYQSPGVSVPGQAESAPRRAAAPAPAPRSSLIRRAGQRMAAAYDALTRCPDPAPAPPSSGGFSTEPSQAARPAQEVIVRVVHEQAPTPSAQGQAPAKHGWFHR